MTDDDDRSVDHQMRPEADARGQPRSSSDGGTMINAPNTGPLAVPSPPRAQIQRELEGDVGRDDMGGIEIEKILCEQRSADRGQRRRQRHGRIRISAG